MESVGKYTFPAAPNQLPLDGVYLFAILIVFTKIPVVNNKSHNRNYTDVKR